ncbi:hypothetical protein GBAR_LOCUS13321 [Geodia barretti]|uniref:Uncharacterized protein n=1 Tax=Geodia barretti TaxID=519541 RepID=A0AA35S562_GEOBA|nr:hypothetical protein GBAR_LOCUS13321 [Geodia barretti]
MAASDKQSYRTNSLISRLMALGCPFLRSMEESVVVRVVLTQGEARARVLSWLFDSCLETCVQLARPFVSESLSPEFFPTLPLYGI